MTRQTWKLLVLAGGIVTNDAIDIIFRSEVELVVFPAITDMTGTTECLVGCYRGTEVINDILLTQFLLSRWVQKFPGPMLGTVYLLGCLSVTGETGLGDFRSAFKVLFQLFKLGMICLASVASTTTAGAVVAATAAAGSVTATLALTLDARKQPIKSSAR